MKPPVVCAVCAWNITQREVILVEPCKLNLSLLMNNCLPEHVLPDTYDQQHYKNAILCTKGMHEPFGFDTLQVCSWCCSALLGAEPRQSKFVLANFLYYGWECLSLEVANFLYVLSPHLMSCNTQQTTEHPGVHTCVKSMTLAHSH